MNSIEKELAAHLTDLKENHYAVGLKTEFEDEGTRLEEALRLKEVANVAGLDLTIKIGGCGALRDMYDARSIGVSRIVAPMIESPYALCKFLTSARLTFQKDDDVSLCVNIETISAYEALDRILNIPCMADLTGIIIGRVDLVRSMGLAREDINGPEIFQITAEILAKAKEQSLECAIGGGIAGSALPFLRKLPSGLLDTCETRNVVFKYPGLFEGSAQEHLQKAIDFELLWLRYKRDYYASISTRDEERIAMLEARFEKTIRRVGENANL